MQNGLCGSEKNAEAGAGTSHPENRQQVVPENASPRNRLKLRRAVADFCSREIGTDLKSMSTIWAEDFLYAGLSALLLLLASQFPQWRLLSFVALIPFLFRVTRASSSGSIRLGLLFGVAFMTVSLVDLLIADSWSALLSLLYGTCLFTLLSWSLYRARAAFGFNPVVTALIWVGFELAVIELGFAKGLLGEAGTSDPHLKSLMLLFGFIIVSFIIVLFDSLLILAVEKAASLGKAREAATYEDGWIWDLYLAPGLFSQKCHLVPDVRGPPAV